MCLLGACEVQEAHIVGRQQEVVEAGVGGGQAVGGGPLRADDKGRLQGGQPLDGHPVGARHKEQQPLLLLLAEAVHHLPEPCHHLHSTSTPIKTVLLAELCP